jgi:predicted lysophospholipase L1 biosynthesis ABC-type transport system permease subunit
MPWVAGLPGRERPLRWARDASGSRYRWSRIGEAALATVAVVARGYSCGASTMSARWNYTFWRAAAFHAVPLAECTEVATFGQKVAANLLGALGLVCLLLAGIGLYSVMSYTVSQRIPEIGIRMAMGARPRNVIGMVVGKGMAMALTGMAVGTVAAFATTRLVATMLVHVDATDPLSFVLAGLFLGTVALLATWLPAFRATRIDPMSALRR